MSVLSLDFYGVLACSIRASLADDLNQVGDRDVRVIGQHEVDEAS